MSRINDVLESIRNRLAVCLPLDVSDSHESTSPGFTWPIRDYIHFSTVNTFCHGMGFNSPMALCLSLCPPCCSGTCSPHAHCTHDAEDEQRTLNDRHGRRSTNGVQHATGTIDENLQASYISQRHISAENSSYPSMVPLLLLLSVTLRSVMKLFTRA